MRKFYTFFCIFSLIYLPLTAHSCPPATNYYSLLNGDFFLSGMWTKTSGGTTCNCFPDNDGACDIVIPSGAVVHILTAVTTSCNITTGSNTTIIVESGGSLTLSGNASVTGTGSFTVASGGTVNIGGDLNLGGNGGVTVNGTMSVGGDLNFNSGGSSLCGTGNLNISGTVNGGAPCGTITLPVTLLSFTVQNQNETVLAKWTTASESNNQFFSVERSADGFNWQLLDTVSGAGFSDYTIDYELTDTNPLSGLSYYRLSQTDFDGATQTFPVVALVRNEITAIPNMVNSGDPVTVYVNGTKNEAVLMELFDAHGKGCYTQQFILTDQNQKFTLQVPVLPAGMYFIKVTVGHKHAEAVKLVVK